MLKVTSFILADDIITVPGAIGPNGQPIPALSNPQPVLRPKFIPGMFSFALSITIRGIDPLKPINISMLLESPSGKTEIPPIQVNLPEQPTKDKSLPAEFNAITINISARNVSFEEKGLYHLIPRVNGIELEKQEIPVFPANK